MLINRKEFISVLEACIPGIDSNSPIEGADTFCLTSDGVSTANSVISVDAPYLLDVPSACFVKAVDFYNLFKKFNTEDVDFSIKDNKIIIKAGKAKATLAMVDIANPSNDLGDIEWLPLPTNFIEALTTCLIPSNKSNMAGIFIDTEAIYSTDRAKINRVKLDNEFACPVWINDAVAKYIIKYNDFNEYSVADNGCIRFKNENGLMMKAKRLNAESYPIASIIKYMDKVADTDSRIDIPDGLMDAINRAVPLAEKQDKLHVISLVFSGEGITVIGNNGSGEYTELVGWNDPDAGWEDDMVTLRLDSNHVGYGLKRGETFQIVEVERNKEKIRTLVVYSDNGIHIIQAVQE